MSERDASTPLAARPLAELLDAVAERAPAPGGGAVSAIAGALAAALGSMVLSYSAGKASLAEHAALHAESGASLLKLRAMLLELADADAQAYAELNEIERSGTCDKAAAAERALAVPAQVVAVASEVLRVLERVENAGAANRWLLSDLAIAAELAGCTMRSAAWMVRINQRVVEDAGGDARVAEEARETAARAVARVHTLAERLDAVV